MKTLNKLAVGAACFLALGSTFAKAETCENYIAIYRYLSIDPFENIRIDRYLKLMDQAQAAKGHLYKRTVKKIQKTCKNMNEQQVRDRLLEGNADQTFCPFSEGSHAELLPSVDLMTVKQVVKNVSESCNAAETE